MALIVNEIFHSIQGESTHAGRPCVFIRLTGCNLRCTYCDTTYAYDQGRAFDIDHIVDEAKSFDCALVEITGGEPLMQTQTPLLVDRLLAADFKVLMETNGSLDISRVSSQCTRIVDIKCPSSGQAHQNDLQNLDRLSTKDQIKFVIGDRTDYEFARKILQAHEPEQLKSGKILFSPLFGRMHPRDLAVWILQDCLGVRLNIQIHKYIWDPDRRGV